MDWEVVGEQTEEQRFRCVKCSCVCGWVALWGCFFQERSYAILEMLAQGWKFHHLFSLKGLVPGGQWADICVLTVVLVVTLLIEKLDWSLSMQSWSWGCLPPPQQASWEICPDIPALQRQHQSDSLSVNFELLPDATNSEEKEVPFDVYICRHLEVSWVHFCSSFHKQILGTDSPKYIKGLLVFWLLIFLLLQVSGDG